MAGFITGMLNLLAGDDECVPDELCRLTLVAGAIFNEKRWATLGDDVIVPDVCEENDERESLDIDEADADDAVLIVGVV